MRTALRWRPVVALAAGAMALGGCSGSSDGSPSSEGSAGSDGTSAAGSDSPNESEADSVLQQALARLAPAAVGETGERMLEFGATAELLALAADNEEWESLTHVGQSYAHSVIGLEDLGLDGTTADFAVTAGAPPRALYLVAGGQDSDAIVSGAQQLGYEEKDGVYSQELDVKNQMTVSIGQIAAEGSDVVLGSIDADLDLVSLTESSDDPTLLDDPQFAALATCLGEAPAVMVADVDDDGKLGGVGVEVVDGSVQSVICAVPADGGDLKDDETAILDDLESGIAANGSPYSELFSDPTSEVSDDAVKVTVQNSASAQPKTILQMLMSWDVPGLTKQ